MPITSDVLFIGEKEMEDSNDKANGTTCTTYGFLSITNTTKMQNTSLQIKRYPCEQQY